MLVATSAPAQERSLKVRDRLSSFVKHIVITILEQGLD